MPLAPGTRLGPYDILAAIGAGGMGEVYKARDTHLDRDVAIKILPEAFAADADRVARFQREAKTLAALNHPNIAQIFGLEQAGDVHALAMELVSGEDLSQRIARGPIPIDEALPIARQIAEALEAAHEQGIVHRDLKPANIKIREDGTLKVLDFGLAKALESPGAPSPTASMSPTITTPAMTQAGIILGTAAYMSPEQARGKTVDTRTDIWAFGCVLYEVLSGRRVFSGEEISDVLAAVLRQDVDWRVLPARTPSRLKQLLERCLDRDPKTRLRDIGEARIAIAASLSGAANETVSITHKRTSVPWVIATVLAIIAAGTSWIAWRALQPAALRPLTRLNVDLGAEVSLPGSGGADVILSPDGTRMVYVSQSRLFTRRLDQANVTQLAGTDGAFAPFFSPDGQWIAFFAQGKLKKVPVQGGAAVALCDYQFNPKGGSWGEDGTIVASLINGGAGLSRVPEAGGAPTPLTELAAGETTHRWPQILPGGKAVLFTAHTSSLAGFDDANIVVMSLGNRRTKTLVHGGTFARFLPGGHLIYVSRGTLFAVPFDLDALELHGQPVPVVEQVAYSSRDGSAQFDVAGNGTAVYRTGTTGSELVTVAWLDRTGQVEPLLAKAGDYSSPRLSPNGQRLALVIRDGSSIGVWVYESQRDNKTRLTVGDHTATDPVWTPDGQHILFQGPEGMFWTRADGAGKPQLLIQNMTALKFLYPFSFTPDGKRMAFYEGVPPNGDIWTVPLAIEEGQLRAGKPEPFLQTAFEEHHPAFSPDGHWLAYVSDESGMLQVYVRGFPDNAGKVQVSNDGGQSPTWSRDRHELFFSALDNRIMVTTYSAKGDAFVADKPKVWSERRIAGAGRSFDLAPDGRIVALMSTDAPDAQQSQNHVIFLENFFDDLRRRVPTAR